MIQTTPQSAAASPSTAAAADARDAALLLVHEIYPSIQGESTHAGRPCVFVRLTGCPLRCTWCDTTHAFTGGDRMTVAEIVERAGSFNIPLVEVTGGEPLAQPNCVPLIAALCDAGHEVLLETSGACDISGTDARCARILDLKCPGSGESDKNLWMNFAQLREGDEIKCVLQDRADYEWALARLAEQGALGRRTVLFSPVSGVLEPAELAAWMIAEAPPVRLQLQLHKYCWPARDRSI